VLDRGHGHTVTLQHHRTGWVMQEWAAHPWPAYNLRLLLSILQKLSVCCRAYACSALCCRYPLYT